MASREQLIGALRKADAAGDASGASRIADMIKNTPTDRPDRQKGATITANPVTTQAQRRSSAANQRNAAADSRRAAEEIKSAEIQDLPEIGDHPLLSELSSDSFSREGLNLAIGFLSAPDEEFANIVKQNIPGSSVEQTELGNLIVTTPEGKFSLNKPGISTRDVESLLFKLGVSLPAGRTASAGVKAIGKIASQEAATEAAIQGAESFAGGEFNPEQVVLAGGLGAAGQAIGEGVSAVGRGVAGDIAPAQKGIIESGQEANIPVLTSDVVDQTRAGKLAAQTGELVPVVGTGGARKAQQESRVQLSESIRQSFPFAGPQDVFESLKRQTSKVKKAAGTARGQIVNQVADVKSNLSNTLPAINKELQRLQFLPNGKARQNVDTETVNALKRYKSDLVNDRTFSGVEQLRTAFREDVKTNRDNLITSKSEAAINRIYSSMTKDLDSAVSENLGEQGLRKWKKSNAVYADEARRLNKSRFKNVLEKGDITPEKVTDLLKSKKPSEISQLYKSLDNKGRSSGRASIIFDASKKSLNEDGTINPNKFLNELNKSRDATNIFFKGGDKKILEGYKKLLGATRRGQDFTATPPTGQSVIGGLTLGAGAFRPEIIGVAAGAGSLARAYESPVFRDFLLKLSNTPAGSTKFDDLLRQNLPVVNSLFASGEEVENLATEAQ